MLISWDNNKPFYKIQSNLFLPNIKKIYQKSTYVSVPTDDILALDFLAIIRYFSLVRECVWSAP